MSERASERARVWWLKVISLEDDEAMGAEVTS